MTKYRVHFKRYITPNSVTSDQIEVTADTATVHETGTLILRQGSVLSGAFEKGEWTACVKIED